MNQRIFRNASLLVGLAIVTACSNDSLFVPEPDGNGGGTVSVFTTKADQTMETFSGCAAYKDYVTEALTLEYTTDFWTGVPCWSCEVSIATVGAPPRAVAFTAAEEDVATASPQPAPSAGLEADGGGSRVNDTNTQEQGVDEADRVESKADGSLMFFLDSGYGGPSQVVILNTADPASTEVISRIPLDDGRFASGMYYDEPNERLSVVSSGGYFFPLAASTDAAFAPEPAPGAQGSLVVSFDVSDPVNWTEISRFHTDAQIISSRRIEDRLHLVSQYGIPLPQELRSQEFSSLVYDQYFTALREEDQERIDELRAEIASQIENAVAATAVADLLPRNTLGQGGEAETLSCVNVYAPPVNQRLGLIQVSSMDTAISSANSIGFLNNGWNVYASASNLYISQTSGGWWFDPAQMQQTAIHRVEIAGPAPIYRGSGVVDGWAHNPYQFSEFDGHLRVATTLQGAAFLPPDGRNNLTNKVSVLALAGDGLNPAGETTTFGDNEDIRSSRFMGERGFVVTFEQIDPLFAINLSDPSAPFVADSLEIPGFSSYIHPLGDDHLLTIGKSGGEDGIGVSNTFQLQIFNIANAFDGDASTRISQDAVEEIEVADNEYAYSTAEYEPLAFNFLDDRNVAGAGTLSIPVQIGSPRSENAFSGFYTYDIDANTSSIDPLLRIDHAQRQEGEGENCPGGREPQEDIDDERREADGTSSGGDETASTVAPPACSSFAPVIWNEPLRTKIVERDFIGGVGQRFFFTFSSQLLRVDTPEPLVPGETEVTQIPLRENP